MLNKVGMVSLGCSKNRVDSEQLLGMLTSCGFATVSDPSLADVIIVNTCGFIDAAKEDSIVNILEMAKFKENGNCKYLVVTGCLSQRYKEDLETELPEVDMFYGVSEYEELAKRLASLCGLDKNTINCGGRLLTTPNFRAYLRIADGCDNRCTYCAIPLIRGGRKSVPMENLIEEATRLAENGVTELTVIAQDTTSYGTDIYGESRICELLRELAKIAKLKWIRLLYTYPNTVDEKLIDTIVSEEKLLNYIDMPIQHIDSEMLKRMNRHGTREHIEDIVKYIRKAAPDFVLRTTAIVGFPGETDEQFDELVRFMEENPFDRLGAFTYSQEDGTPASEFDGQIDEDVKQSRYDRLYSMQQPISLEFNKKRVGSMGTVLVEMRDGDTLYCRSYAEAPEIDGFIVVNDAPEDINKGDYITVKLVEAKEYDMIGELA